MSSARYTTTYLLVLSGLVLASLSAPTLADVDTRQLTFVDQSELPRLMADRVAFLPDGHAILGGWFEWPNTPLVALVPNNIQAMQTGNQAASPRFAYSPDGKSVAFWKRVKVGPQDRAELNVVRIDTQMVTTLGEPIGLSDSMYLAWLAPNGPIVYATEDPQRGVGLLYALDLAGGKPRRLIELHDGQWRGLEPASATGQVLAQWAGSKEVFAVNCLPGDYVPPVMVSAAMPAPDGSKKTLELDAQGQLILGLSTVEGVVVDRGVRAAQWRPDGKLILYVKDKEVYAVGPTGGEPRPLANVGSLEANIFLRGCTWSSDGVNVAFWGACGTGGRAWRASLGEERITARFLFPADAPVKADSRLWVVAKFRYDAAGNIVEPLWPTLKAMFVVTRILRTPEGTVAEAQNSGGQAGTVDRLGTPTATPTESAGHISIGIAGQPAATWSKSVTYQFRPGLVGWLEKTKYTGKPDVLTVERQLLQAAGQ